VKRVWAVGDFDLEAIYDLDLMAAPELRTVIHGQAFVQYGDVRVIGGDKCFTEFRINLQSRESAEDDVKNLSQIWAVAPSGARSRRR
jgi:hypothetical protein